MKDIKVERRGKYGGVKIHLDSSQCEILLKWIVGKFSPEQEALLGEMILAVKKLVKRDPDTLKDRTDAEVAAILAKESEKARLQLERLKEGKEWKEIPSKDLEKALLKHVK